jgi:hypothetical protein
LKASDSGYWTSLSVTNMSGTIPGNFIPAANVTLKVELGDAGIVTLS